MSIISAYQQVGTYRGAAVLCGTTHKTVKRVIERFEAEQNGLAPASRTVSDVTMRMSRRWSLRRSRRRRAGSAGNGYCRSRGPPATTGRTAISVAWWRR